MEICNLQQGHTLGALRTSNVGQGGCAEAIYMPNWWYILDLHGKGTAVEFPIKVKPMLSLSTSTYMTKEGRLCQAPRFANERLCNTV